jgi:hypothetical protein
VPCGCGPAERAEAEAAGPNAAPALQRLATVQRVHPDFAIRGKLASARTDRFHFDKDQATLDGDELQKAATYATKRVGDLRLRGITSEEEDPGLAGARIDAVEAALLHVIPDTGAAQREPKPEAGVGNRDYRLARRVDVFDLSVPVVQPPKFPNVPCGPEPNAFTKARDRAGEMIMQALAALNQPDEEPTRSALAKFFHGPEKAAAIADGLKLISGQLQNYAKEIGWGGKGGYRCHDERDSVVAANEGTGADAYIVVGQKFVTSDKPEKQALTILHESSHGAVGLVTDDLAYEWQRLLPFLPLEQALRNADSYAGLVAMIVGQQVGNPVGPDKISGDIPGPEQARATEILGWIEQYVIRTRQEVGSLHVSMNSARTKQSWMKGVYRDEIFPAVGTAFAEARRAAQIPVTTPPDLDTTALVAGAYDRLSVLRDGLVNQAMTIELSADDEVRWSAGPRGPGTAIHLPRSFFQKSGMAQVTLLLTALLRATGAIEGPRAGGYADLIIGRGGKAGMPG